MNEVRPNKVKARNYTKQRTDWEFSQKKKKEKKKKRKKKEKRTNWETCLRKNVCNLSKEKKEKKERKNVCNDYIFLATEKKLVCHTIEWCDDDGLIT